MVITEQHSNLSVFSVNSSPSQSPRSVASYGSQWTDIGFQRGPTSPPSSPRTGRMSSSLTDYAPSPPQSPRDSDNRAMFPISENPPEYTSSSVLFGRVEDASEADLISMEKKIGLVFFATFITGLSSLLLCRGRLISPNNCINTFKILIPICPLAILGTVLDDLSGPRSVQLNSYKKIAQTYIAFICLPPICIGTNLPSRLIFHPTAAFINYLMRKIS